jgi:hypothetical protein
MNMEANQVWGWQIASWSKDITNMEANQVWGRQIESNL